MIYVMENANAQLCPATNITGYPYAHCMSIQSNSFFAVYIRNSRPTKLFSLFHLGAIAHTPNALISSTGDRNLLRGVQLL